MAVAYYLSHPQVIIDPSKSVPNWSLSPEGRTRLQGALEGDWHCNIGTIWSSTEIKALETAEFFARAKGLDVHTAVQMGENDRSATGYLDEEAFEQARIAFFQRPNESYRGWETARDAQKRIMRAIKIARLKQDRHDVLFCGHGAVGSLLMTALADETICLENDQPPGGGNVFAFDLNTNELLFRWVPLESLSTICAVA